ncbi:MAG: site-2 protease family protein [Chromatiales bacterium]|jgi:Zn-dependent protease|nr:MAG: site-2 protease family protein [Chromatiales bacterium]
MSDLDFAASIQLLSAAVIPVLFGIALHEAAHGWMARQFGDRTAELLGRITANPIKHIDPVGTVVVPLVLAFLSLPPFGWAKPVPVNARNLRNPKRDMLLVAAAGPASNLVMALFWVLVLALALRLPVTLPGVRQFLLSMAQIGITFNILLAIFNLIPIPPLDGGRVLRGMVPEALGRKLDALEPYGLILVMGLLALGVLGRLVWPLVQLVSAVFFSLAGV